MAREQSYGVTINGWERLLALLKANAEDFQHLEIYRLQLEEALAQVRDATRQQAAHAAAKLAETRRLHSTLTNGRKLATFLRYGVRRLYGDGSEKLAELNHSPPMPPMPPTEATE